MTLTNFIGEVWAAHVLQSLKKNLVYGQAGVINRDFEGDIRGKGDTVRITAHGPITIGNYDPASGISAPELLDDASTTLEITQAKYFNFQIGDIDAAQMNVNLMASATADAAYRLGDTADQFIAGIMAAQAGNTIGSDGSDKVFDGSTNDVTDEILACKQKLDEANAQNQGRFIILPPWVVRMLLKDSSITDPAWSGVEGIMKNGQIGRLYGFDILQSNNVPNSSGDHYKVIAGTPQATTFADSVNDVEAYRPEAYFSDALRGLHCYGCKVIQPAALVCLTCAPS